VKALAAAPVQVADPLDQILESAERHGQDSDPDHEVGDLQDALRIVWALLTPAARVKAHAAFFADHAHWDEATA